MNSNGRKILDKYNHNLKKSRNRYAKKDIENDYLNQLENDE
jgi:hypothetical protein